MDFNMARVALVLVRHLTLAIVSEVGFVYQIIALERRATGITSYFGATMQHFSAYRQSTHLEVVASTTRFASYIIITRQRDHGHTSSLPMTRSKSSLGFRADPLFHENTFCTIFSCFSFVFHFLSPACTF